MRKLILVTLAMTSYVSGAVAQNGQGRLGLLGGPYEVVAPSINGDPSSPVVGQIYYDTSANQFKGINQSGDASVLSLPVGENVVASSGTAERVERARISGSASATTACSSGNCQITRQSGSWLALVTRVSTGIYSLTVNSGIFSGPPSCVVYVVNGAGVFMLQDATDNTVTSIPNIRFTSAVAPTTSVDVAFDIICMGPR